jgi:hypothetical protein
MGSLHVHFSMNDPTSWNRGAVRVVIWDVALRHAAATGVTRAVMMLQMVLGPLFTRSKNLTWPLDTLRLPLNVAGMVWDPRPPAGGQIIPLRGDEVAG